MVMRALHYLAAMKQELLKKVELSIFKTVYVSILTYGHESWVITESASIRSYMQHYVTRCIALQKFLNMKPLLFQIEKSQLR